MIQSFSQEVIGSVFGAIYDLRLEETHSNLDLENVAHESVHIANSLLEVVDTLKEIHGLSDRPSIHAGKEAIKFAAEHGLGGNTILLLLSEKKKGTLLFIQVTDLDEKSESGEGIGITAGQLQISKKRGKSS